MYTSTLRAMYPNCRKCKPQPLLIDNQYVSTDYFEKTSIEDHAISQE